MKKMILFVLALSAFGILLGGCSKSDDAATDTTKTTETKTETPK